MKPSKAVKLSEAQIANTEKLIEHMRANKEDSKLIAWWEDRLRKCKAVS